jgi:signal peptidase II
MLERSYFFLFWILALVGLSADQASKYGVFHWLADVPGHQAQLFESESNGGFQLVAQFQRTKDGSFRRDQRGNPIPHVNHGALFGFMRGHKSMANAAFAVISLLAALAILYWSLQKSTRRDPWLCISLGLILAGTLGNLYDRLIFDGVRDFLHWNYLFDWPVFNLADCCLVVGASFLLLQAFFAPAQVREQATDTKPSHQQQEQEPTAVAVGHQGP